MKKTKREEENVVDETPGPSGKQKFLTTPETSGTPIKKSTSTSEIPVRIKKKKRSDRDHSLFWFRFRDELQSSSFLFNILESMPKGKEPLRGGIRKTELEWLKEDEEAPLREPLRRI